MSSHESIQVTIAHTHELVRDGLRMLLAQEQDIQVTDDAPAEAFQVIEVVNRIMPHVLILDSNLAMIDGTSIIGQVRAQSSRTKPLILLGELDHGLIFTFLKDGARGYLTQQTNAISLKRAIRAVHDGELWVERKVLAAFFDEHRVNGGSEARQRSANGLTEKEQALLSYLVSGCTNKEIAVALGISEKTVKCHLSSIFKKLNVRRRFQAVLCALRYVKAEANGVS